MRASVKEAFVGWSVGHEGYCNFMYADTLNLVTTGIGNLIDAGPRNGLDCSVTAMAPALKLPWTHKYTGVPATGQEIVEAWQVVKHAGLQAHGGFAYEPLTDLVLSREAVSELVESRLDSNDTILAHLYPSYPEWPADAQFAINSMAWAMGAAFHFPRFAAALAKSPPDFEEAAVQSEFQGGGKLDEPTSRNFQNAAMFRLADAAQKQGWDFDECRFITSSREAPTLPELPPSD